MVRRQRVADHGLAGCGRDFLGGVSEAAYNCHSRETAAGLLLDWAEEGGGDAGGGGGGAEGGEEGHFGLGVGMVGNW